MRAAKITPPLPPNPAPHIVGRLMEVGLWEAAGTGIEAISWQAMDAYERRTGAGLSAWEARLIRRLSADYVAMSLKAESEKCPAPWRTKPTQSDRDRELAQLMAVLG